MYIISQIKSMISLVLLTYTVILRDLRAVALDVHTYGDVHRDLSSTSSSKTKCYKQRQDAATCVSRDGYWSKTQDPVQYAYPYAIEKWVDHEKWGRCDINPPPWVWKTNPACAPFKVPHRRYEHQSICEIINGRNVLIVGDSINNEFFHSFIGQAWPPDQPFREENADHMWEATVNNDTTWNAAYVNISCPIQSQNFGIHFVRNYNLTTNTEIPAMYAYDKNEMKNEPRSWVKVIEDRNIEILFMNRGAHISESKDILDSLSKAFTYMRKNHPNVLTMFRNTPVGHSDCDAYRTSPPLKEPPQVDPVLHFLEHGWHRFYIQNPLEEDLIKNKFPEVIYLDVATSTNLRADSHMGGKDCLHYCIPGPIDNWTKLMLTVIKESDMLGCSHMK